MLRYFYSILFIGSLFLEMRSADGQNVLGAQLGPIEIQGEMANSLKPVLLIKKIAGNWEVEIDYVAQTNFSKFAWLKITNRFGSKLQLLLTNGMELQATNTDALAAMNLPSQTTVSDVMRGVHPSNRRGSQWLWTRLEALSGAAGFGLQSTFNVSFTNDVVLQVTPLLYKVETNEVTAHLVEFPPIKVRLMANGEVRKEE